VSFAAKTEYFMPFYGTTLYMLVCYMLSSSSSSSLLYAQGRVKTIKQYTSNTQSIWFCLCLSVRHKSEFMLTATWITQTTSWWWRWQWQCVN